MLTHARKSETFWYPEVRNSLLVNLVQTLSKSVNICKSYCKKFTGAFFMDHSVFRASRHGCCDWRQMMKVRKKIKVKVCALDIAPLRETPPQKCISP